MADYPLYPKLSEVAALEAQVIVDRFKESMRKVADEALGQLYTDVVPHIESDGWINYRNAMMDGFRNYSNRKVQGEYDFAEIRRQIFYQFREEILADLNQDNLEKIKKLEEDVTYWKNMYSDSRRFP